MNRALLDTDILSYYITGADNVVKNLETYFKRIPVLKTENWEKHIL